MGCFGTGCRTRGASLERGVFAAGGGWNVPWGSWIEGRIGTGGGGDGGRIGGERVGCPFGIVGEPYHSNPTTRA